MSIYSVTQAELILEECLQAQETLLASEARPPEGAPCSAQALRARRRAAARVEAARHGLRLAIERDIVERENAAADDAEDAEGVESAWTLSCQ